MKIACRSTNVSEKHKTYFAFVKMHQLALVQL